MMSINVFVSERRAANLLAQIRWRNGVYCPRCRAESVIRYGSYRVFQPIFGSLSTEIEDMSEFLLLVGKLRGLDDHRLIRFDRELSAA